MYLKKSFTVVVSFLLFGGLLIGAPLAARGQKGWVGTWATAPYAAGKNTPPAPYLANNTLRQIVRVSIGGDVLQVKFSNITGKSDVVLQKVTIATSPDGTKSEVDPRTIVPLKFAGKYSATMPAGTRLVSDAVRYKLKAGQRLAITIYYGACESNEQLTHHYGSRTFSYILEGDHTTNAAFEKAVPVERWYTITGIDVAARKSSAVAVLGNSITDGYGLHGGLQNRWTDVFSENLLKNKSTRSVAVLNLGIGGTLVSGSGVQRFDTDVLGQNGVRWLIIFYGVNDIGNGVSADKIIDTYNYLIKKAHAANLKVYGATITPFKGSNYFNDKHEKTRSVVNNWIRTAGNFDACLDFDRVIRDPADSTRLLPAFSNDWLHPNAEGLRALGNSIELNLFSKLPPVEFK